MNPDPLRYFRVEAAELAELLSEGLLELERGLPVAERVGALLRHAHTLKGAARVVRQIEIADLAHAVEELLSPHRGSSEPLPRETVERGLRHVNAIAQRVKDLPTSPGDTAVAEVPTLRVDLPEVDAQLEGLAELVGESAMLGKAAAELAPARELAALLTRKLGAVRAEGAYEGLLRLARELEVALGRIEEKLERSVGRIDRELGQAYDAAQRLRLVPAANLFAHLERAAHSAAGELGKKVEFLTRGGDVRLDVYVLEVAQQALLHVVRNAVAHGIEPERVRVQAHKPARGRIEVAVRHTTREVVFTCEDDGAGLDLEAARAALERHGISRASTQGLGHEEIVSLMTERGASTAATVTGVAGRGIGHDVLRDAARRLNGTIKMESERGRGFKVELRVPSIAAAIEGLVVEDAGLTATLPLDTVIRSQRVRPSDISRTSQGDALVQGGEVIPFLPLRDALRGASQGRHRTCSAVVMKGARGSVALGVERLLGVKSVVVREVPRLAGARPIVAGAVLDVLGRPGIVIDADALFEEARQRATPAPVAPAAPARILVVDDSLTTRIMEKTILESAGYTVELATSGEEGLVAAERGKFSLFLVDVEMPGIDGFTFVSTIRAHPVLSSTPAVLVSSRDAPEDFERGKAVGANGYVVKGRFDQRELLSLIGKLVSS